MSLIVLSMHERLSVLSYIVLNMHEASFVLNIQSLMSANSGMHSAVELFSC